MATSTHRSRAPGAILVFLLAAAIGCTPILAAILASAPSAEVAR